MIGPPPGWYLETEDGQQGRYWDGHAWTDHVVEIPEGLTLQSHEDLQGDEDLTEEIEAGPPRFRTVRIAAVIPFVVVLTATAALLGAALSEPTAAPPSPARATTTTAASATNRSTSSTTESPTTSTTSSPTSTSTTSSTTTTLLQPATMIDVSGSTPQTTKDFTVLIPSWDLRWSYDCGTTAGGTDVFALSVVGQDPSSVPETVVKSSLPKATGVVERDDGPSTFALLVISSCKWQVAALTAP